MHVYCIPGEEKKVEAELRSMFESLGYKPASVLQETLLEFNTKYGAGEKVLERIKKATILATTTHLLLLWSKRTHLKGVGEVSIVYCDALSLTAGEALDYYFTRAP